MSAALLRSAVQLLVLAGLVLVLFPGPSPRRPEAELPGSRPTPRRGRRAPEGDGAALARGGLRRLLARARTHDAVARRGQAPLARRLAVHVRAAVAWGRRHPLAAFVAVAMAVLVGPVALLVVVPVPLAGWWRSRRRARRGDRELADELPDVVDLLRLAVDAGCTVHLAVEAVARHGVGRSADHLAAALEATRRGARLGDSLALLRDEAPVLAPALDALIAADRYGTPLGPVLTRLAEDARGTRRRRAEAAARQVPVQLLFPLVACILPAIGFLTVLPVASSAMGSLR